MADKDGFEFAADLAPDTRWPRVRFNFANGWSASLVVQTHVRRPCDAVLASLAAAPTDCWGMGVTELGATEATADEAIAWLHAISLRQRPS